MWNESQFSNTATWNFTLEFLFSTHRSTLVRAGMKNNIRKSGGSLKSIKFTHFILITRTQEVKESGASLYVDLKAHNPHIDGQYQWFYIVSYPFNLKVVVLCPDILYFGVCLIVSYPFWWCSSTSLEILNDVIKS